MFENFSMAVYSLFYTDIRQIWNFLVFVTLKGNRIYSLIGYCATLTRGKDFSHGLAEFRVDIVQICAMVWRALRRCVYYAKCLERDEVGPHGPPSSRTSHYRHEETYARIVVRPGWSRDRLDIDFPRCVTDDKRSGGSIFVYDTGRCR